MRNVLLQMYCFETLGKLFDIEQLPALTAAQQADYQLWVTQRRAMSSDEVPFQQWLKVCPAGYITEMVLYPDGRLEEQHLFKPIRCKGDWLVRDGHLFLSIDKGKNHYTIEVVAKKDSAIHCAIEYKNRELHSYLKVIQAKPIAPS
ncbi:hypothetical protein [Thaumasiovibrio sp. DFM-14]|uniref:hypothetical protein n=1 Tax=Thaumasiovibrio sp. DFM-14 TaxID=3384792 RepID=UPI0039A042C9